MSYVSLTFTAICTGILLQYNEDFFEQASKRMQMYFDIVLNDYSCPEKYKETDLYKILVLRFQHGFKEDVAVERLTTARSNLERAISGSFDIDTDSDGTENEEVGLLEDVAIRQTFDLSSVPLQPAFGGRESDMIATRTP